MKTITKEYKFYFSPQRRELKDARMGNVLYRTSFTVLLCGIIFFSYSDIAFILRYLTWLHCVCWCLCTIKWLFLGVWIYFRFKIINIHEMEKKHQNKFSRVNNSIMGIEYNKHTFFEFVSIFLLMLTFNLINN